MHAYSKTLLQSPPIPCPHLPLSVCISITPLSHFPQVYEKNMSHPFSNVFSSQLQPSTTPSTLYLLHPSIDVSPCLPSGVEVYHRSRATLRSANLLHPSIDVSPCLPSGVEVSHRSPGNATLCRLKSVIYSAKRRLNSAGSTADDHNVVSEQK